MIRKITIQIDNAAMSGAILIDHGFIRIQNELGLEQIRCDAFAGSCRSHQMLAFIVVIGAVACAFADGFGCIAFQD